MNFIDLLLKEFLFEEPEDEKAFTDSVLARLVETEMIKKGIQT